MLLRFPATLLLALSLFLSSALGGDKTEARRISLGGAAASELRVRVPLASADTCLVTENNELKWIIDGWVTGMELYKVLMDPAASCDNPYPFTITEISMPMYFANATPLVVAVDVETVDNISYPGCPIPGIVTAISQEYSLDVPAGGGLFDIWVPLDSPIVVNEPFFAGFYIGNALDPSVGAAVVTDSFPVPPLRCVAYNIWDETIGWIDLANNSYYNFPGRLAMAVSGIPGSGEAEPEPQVSLLSPSAGAVLYGTVDLWCYDTSGSSIIDFVVFEYSDGGPFVEIGRDYDGYRPLRDGISQQGSGGGFGLAWDFSGLTEGTYTLRATAHDTLGRSDSSSASIYLEPTPPIAEILSPDNGSDVCPPTTIIMSSSDENLSYVEMYRNDGHDQYSVGLTAMSQLTVGDANGNPLDGNLSINGEFGPYYSGPVAAVMALQAWVDRNVTGLIAASETMQTVAEELALLFDTRSNQGTYDEDLYAGLRDYSASHGDNLEFDFKRNPDYFTLRTWVEVEERVVILGLSGHPAVFLTVDGFRGWTEPDGSYMISVANPVSGTVQNFPMRDNVTYSEIAVYGVWQRVDIMISVLVKYWTPGATVPLGADFNGADGWSFSLAGAGMSVDSLYFIRAVGRDASFYRGRSTVLVRHSCSNIFVAGDFDGDGVCDISDLFLLISFITRDGSAPVGGAARADTNCDNYVNITDVVYFMNYLFGDASPPCY